MVRAGISYTPQRVKSAVCGHGGAAKDQVARMVQSLLALRSMPGNDHCSDALAVAICHLNGAPLTDAVRRATQAEMVGPRSSRPKSASAGARA